MRKIPSSDAYGDWLRRMGDNGGLYVLLEENRRILELEFAKAR